MRHTQRRILHLTRLLTKDRTQQLLLSRQLRLTLRRNLAHQNILSPHLRTNINDPPLIQIAQTLLTHIGNIPRNLLRAQLRIASLNLILLNMDRRKVILLHNTLTDQNSILIVATFPAHKGHQNVLPQSQLPILRRRTIRNHLTRIHIIALAHNRSLIDTRPRIRAHKLPQAIALHLTILIHNLNFPRRRRHHLTIHLTHHHLTRIDGHLTLNTRPTHRRPWTQQRHRLTLHICTHQRTVHIIVLQERNKSRSHAHRLARRNIHIVHTIRALLGKLTLIAGQHPLLSKFIILCQLCIRLRNPEILLIIGRTIVHFQRHKRLDPHFTLAHKLCQSLKQRLIHAHTTPSLDQHLSISVHHILALMAHHSSELTSNQASIISTQALIHFPIRRLHKTIRIHLPIRRQIPNQTNLRQRIRLIHELRKLAPPEKLLHRRHHRANIDQRIRSRLTRLLNTHALLHHTLHT